MSELQHPVLTTTFLPLQRKSLARYIAHGTPPQTALEQAGLMAAQLCRARLHTPAEIERLLHEACALFASHDGAATQLTGTGGGGRSSSLRSRRWCSSCSGSLAGASLGR